MFISIGEAAVLLGVSVSTLRRWEKEDVLVLSYQTTGRHRRYAKDFLLDAFNLAPHPTSSLSHAAFYARVSSSDQKNDLETQKNRLENYCKSNFRSFESIPDPGSGLNHEKTGLKKLPTLIRIRNISHLILTHEDSPLRFGSEIVFSFCEANGIQVVILDDEQNMSFEMELRSDVIKLMTVFRARLHGRRSHQNKRRAA